MGCPFYREIGGKRSCQENGFLSEEKAEQDCLGRYLLCYDQTRVRMLERLKSENMRENSSGRCVWTDVEPIRQRLSLKRNLGSDPL